MLGNIKGKNRKDNLPVSIVALTKDIPKAGFVLYLRS